jgi:hypothetical protein
MEPDDLKQYKDFLPSRAKLGRLSLWAPTEEERLAASRMLDVMIKAGITDKEPTPWEDSPWNPVNMPTLEEMKLSPTGRLTLELFASCKPVGDSVVNHDVTAAAAFESSATDAQVTNASSPAIEDDGVNLYLKQLDWPPKSSPPPKALEDDDTVKHKWVAGRPSEPSKDLRPIADSDLSNNSPLY